MTAAPLVSICIPTYDMGRFIAEAIDSALAQTVRDFEIVVCDNRSTDDTAAVVAKYGDRRLRYVLNETNVGIWGNFNRTIEQARGRFVKFLCADDRLEPAYLERALDVFSRHPRVGIVTALHTVIDAHGQLIARHAPHRRRGPEIRTGQEILRRTAWHHNEIGTPTHVMLRREALVEVGGFDLSYEIPNDWELWLRVCTRWDAGFLRDYLVVVRSHGAQESRKKDVSIIAAGEVFRMAQRLYPDRRGRRVAMLVRNAETYVWEAGIRLLRRDAPGARRLFSVVRRNVPLWALTPYMLAHAPARFAHGWRRRVALGSGRICEQ